MNLVRSPLSLATAFALVLGASPVRAAKKRAAPAPAPAPAAAPVAAPAPTELPAVLDSYETVDWATTAFEGNAVALDRVPGAQGNALRVTYDLKDSKQWVQIAKPFNAGPFQGRALEVWVQGKGKANTLEVKLIDEDGTNYGARRAKATNAAAWTKLTLNESDFAYFWGGDKALGPVKEVYVAITSDEGGAGEVLFDELRLVHATNAGTGADGMVADGETADGWVPANAEGATIQLGTAPGRAGKALAIAYSIPAQQWVGVRREVNLNLTPTSVLSLIVRGQGDLNNLEIKVVDRDESVFGRTFEGLAGDGAWQEIRLPLAELAYLWGGDDKLDASLIRFVDMAISGPGGKGKVLIDDLRVAP